MNNNTYNLLKQSLLTLLEKKPFDKIKVNDICEIAMIHRTTFYNYFSDKYELLEYCITDIQAEIKDSLNSQKHSNIQDFYTNLIMLFLNHIEQHLKFYKSVLRKNEGSDFFDIFNKISISNITKMLNSDSNIKLTNHISIDVISHFYSGAISSTLIWWINTDNNLSKEELCDNIIKLIFNN